MPAHRHGTYKYGAIAYGWSLSDTHGTLKGNSRTGMVPLGMVPAGGGALDMVPDVVVVWGGALHMVHVVVVVRRAEGGALDMVPAMGVDPNACVICRFVG